MQDKGIYYSKLIRIFTTIACIVAIILILGLSLMLVNIEQRESHMLKSSLDVQVNQAEQSIMYITETINRFSADSNILAWAESEPGSPEYYFYALKLYKMLGDETVFQDYLNIRVGITTPNPRSFIISSPDGTEEKDLELQDRIKASPTAMPILDSDGNLASLKLIATRSVNKTDIVMTGEFDLPKEIKENEYFTIAILDNKDGTLFSSDKEFDSAIKKAQITGSSFKAGKYSCYEYSYNDYGFSLIYGIRKNTQYLPILILILLFIVLIVIFIFALSRITRNLYKPVGDVISQIASENMDGNDEFAIIKDNCNKIEHLYSELEKALNEQYSLEEKQKYRAFVEGIPPTKILDNDQTSFFIVAIAIQNQLDKNIDTLLVHLDSFAKNTPHLHTVRTDMNEAVLVQKADTKQEAEACIYNAISSFISQYDDAIDVKFAISDISIGYKNIQSQYKEAKEIMQYRYKARNKAILTKDDIDKNEPTLDFPFQDENKLITSLLAGRSDALEIYDRIVRTNLEKALLPKELRKFVYMMIGITTRLFQELKEEPRDAIGKEIEWDSLYNNPDYVSVLEEIRNILSLTMEYQSNTDKAEENKIIKEMKEYINTHYMENIMLIDLSTAFNLTPKYCSYIFNQLSNDNFKNYLNSLRIQKACEMIKENPEIKISYLSTKIGFSSSNTFIRVFNKYVGITPKLYADKIIKKER